MGINMTREGFCYSATTAHLEDGTDSWHAQFQQTHGGVHRDAWTLAMRGTGACPWRENDKVSALVTPSGVIGEKD